MTLCPMGWLFICVSLSLLGRTGLTGRAMAHCFTLRMQCLCRDTATDATLTTDATLATDTTESLQFHNFTTLTMRTNTTKRSQSQRYDSTTVRFGACSA